MSIFATTYSKWKKVFLCYLGEISALMVKYKKYLKKKITKRTRRWFSGNSQTVLNDFLQSHKDYFLQLEKAWAYAHCGRKGIENNIKYLRGPAKECNE